MANGIPMPGLPGDALLKGIGTGTDMFRAIMQPRIAREQLAERAKEHAASIAQQRAQLAQQARQHAETLAQQRAQMEMLAPFRAAQAQKAMADAAWSNLLTGTAQGQPAPQPTSDPAPQAAFTPDAQPVDQPAVPEFGALQSYIQKMGMGQPTGQVPQFGALQSYLQSMATGQPMPYGQAQPAVEPDQTVAGSIQTPQIDNAGEIPAEAHADAPLTPAVKQPEETVSEGDPSREWMNRVAGIKGVPKVDVQMDKNGHLIKTYPNGKVTRIRVTEGQADLARAQEFAKGDASLAMDLTKQVPAAMEMMQTYNNLDAALNNPLWRDMQDNAVAKYGTDYGRKANLLALRELGTPEQKALLGKVQSLTNKIVSQSASLFKGPFRVSEQSLVENMKPSDKDPIDVALAKLKEMRKAVNYQQFINTRVPTLIRNNNMSAQDAFNTAMNESGAHDFFDGVKEKYADKEPELDYTKMSDEELKKLIGGS